MEDIQLRNILRPMNLPRGDIQIAGTETVGAEFTEQESKILIKMLDRMYYVNSIPSIKKCISDNYDILVDLIRVVKTNTKQPFRGMFAKGNDLTIKPLYEEDFKYVWGSDTDKTFEHNVTKGTVYDYVGTDADPETTKEEEGIIILGFLDLNPDPKIYKVRLMKNGEYYIPQELEFDKLESDNFVALPEPYVILPESTYQIKAKAYEDGDTYLIPVGFRVLMAKVDETLF